MRQLRHRSVDPDKWFTLDDINKHKKVFAGYHRGTEWPCMLVEVDADLWNWVWITEDMGRFGRWVLGTPDSIFGALETFALECGRVYQFDTAEELFRWALRKPLG